MSSFPGEQSPGPPRRVPLGRLLVGRGLLTEEQLIEGLLEQDRTGELLGKVLIRLGFVDEPSVAMALASQHGGPLKTEYGFATGFDSGRPTEPASEAPLRPDPVVSLPLPSEVRLPEHGGVASATIVAAPVDQMLQAEHDRALGQIDALIAERDATRAELDAARTRIADLERELVAAREQLDERRSRTAQLEDEVAGARLAAETAIAALQGVAQAPS
jgi:hypothetical protein